MGEVEVVIKIAVGRGESDYGRRILFDRVDNPPVAMWKYYRRRRSEDTKYATVEVAGWMVEFHEYRRNRVYSQWLKVRRKLDKYGPGHKMMTLRLPEADVGGTLVLRSGKKNAHAELCAGDLSAELWDRYLIRAVETRNAKDWLLYRYFQGENGMLRYVDTVFTDGKVRPVLGCSEMKPEMLKVKGAKWVVVLSASEADGNNLSLMLYAAVDHATLERELGEFIAQHDCVGGVQLNERNSRRDVGGFFRGQLRNFAAYCDEDY